jgi:signal transduction histidine kinase
MPEFIEMIRHEAYSMSAIVEDLLVAARVETGHLSIVPTRVALRNLVFDSLDIVLPATGRAVRNDVVDDSIAFADEMRARQVLRNLIVNSVRHGGPTSWVASEVTDTHVLIHVCDDGPGVHRSLSESVFDPYVSRQNDGHRPESVGLGLTVSRQLARLMGGDVEYSHPGHCRFTFTLPIADS